MKYRSVQGIYVPQPEKGHVVFDAIFKIPLGQREGVFGWGLQRNPVPELGDIFMLYCYLPHDTEALHGLPVVQSPQEAQNLRIQTAYWIWDGNLEKPTLQPSILSHPPFAWHGYLTAGFWRACE